MDDIKKLRSDRKEHDALFAIDNPRPTRRRGKKRVEPESMPERIAAHIWVIWLALAVLGALISAPHTIGEVMPTIEDKIASPTLQAFYAFAVFLAVEGTLLALAFVSAIAAARISQTRKQASLAGSLNALLNRLGFSWATRRKFNLDGVPEKKPATGGALAFFLLVMAVAFNLFDALGTVEELAPYVPIMILVSRVLVGLLGPIAIWVSGHNFAEAVVFERGESSANDDTYRRELAAWKKARDRAWGARNEHPKYISGIVGSATVPIANGNGRGGNGHARG